MMGGALRLHEHMPIERGVVTLSKEQEARAR